MPTQTLSSFAERRIGILSNVAAYLAEADELLESLDLEDKNNIGRHISEAVKATAELAYRISEGERDAPDNGRLVDW